MSLLIYSLGVDTNTHTHTYPHESDYKKPGVQAGVCLIQKEL